MPSVDGKPNYKSGDGVKHLQVFIDRAAKDDGWVAVESSKPGIEEAKGEKWLEY